MPSKVVPSISINNLTAGPFPDILTDVRGEGSARGGGENY